MSSRIWLGILLIVFGLGFFMHQADILDFAAVLSTWWPLILIIIGVLQLLNRPSSSLVVALLFVLLGGLFLVNQWVDMNITAFIWPLLLIFFGLVFIFSRVNREKPNHATRDINSFCLFSGTDVRSQSSNFQGGSVSAIFGGADIDLCDAIISEDGATLDLSAIFGGISITVPENVHVEISGMPIFGGWEDKTRLIRNDDTTPIVLKLNCLAFCGGIEIKN